MRFVLHAWQEQFAVRQAGRTTEKSNLTARPSTDGRSQLCHVSPSRTHDKHFEKKVQSPVTPASPPRQRCHQATLRLPQPPDRRHHHHTPPHVGRREDGQTDLASTARPAATCGCAGREGEGAPVAPGGAPPRRCGAEEASGSAPSHAVERAPRTPWRAPPPECYREARRAPWMRIRTHTHRIRPHTRRR